MNKTYLKRSYSHINYQKFSSGDASFITFSPDCDQSNEKNYYKFITEVNSNNSANFSNCYN